MENDFMRYNLHGALSNFFFFLFDFKKKNHFIGMNQIFLKNIPFFKFAKCQTYIFTSHDKLSYKFTIILENFRGKKNLEL